MVELKKTIKQGSSEIVIGSLIIPGQSWKEVLKPKTAAKMFDLVSRLGLTVLWNGLQRTRMASLQLSFWPLLHCFYSSKCNTVLEIGQDD